MSDLRKQVTEILRDRIRSGLLPPGSVVPGERPLAEELGISRVTVRQALRTLELEGLVRAGRGVRLVSPSPVEAVEEGTAGLTSLTDIGEAHDRAVSAKVLKFLTRPSDLDEADLLQLVPGAPVHELIRLRLVEGIPLLVDHSLIPAHLTPGFDQLDFGDRSLYQTLAEYGCAPVRAECAIESRLAPPAYAELLDLDSAAPVLEIRQVTFDQAGRAVQWCRSICQGERYRFRAILEVGGGTQVARRTLAETGRRPTI